MSPKLTVEIQDVFGPTNVDPPTIVVDVVAEREWIFLHVHGHALADGGHGEIGLEIYDGKTRLLVWNDINDEDPTHVIDLEGCHESQRLVPLEDDPRPPETPRRRVLHLRDLEE